MVLQAPSNAPAATELELLEQYTTIVPDTVSARAHAWRRTVSAPVLRILQAITGKSLHNSSQFRARCWQVLMTNQQDSIPNKAATSSAGVIRGILRNPADLQQFKVCYLEFVFHDAKAPPPHPSCSPAPSSNCTCSHLLRPAKSASTAPMSPHDSRSAPPTCAPAASRQFRLPPSHR